MASFESLFKDRDKASDVKAILDLKGYTKNGNWMGLTNNKTELLSAYYVLKPILKNGKVTTQARIFYSEFQLPENYINERQFRIEPFNDSREEFERIFNNLITK